MIIDEIKPMKGHLVGLYSDGELIVEIDSDLAAEKALKPMSDCSVEYLRELLTHSQQRRARSKALYLLEYRDYSSRDMKKRLRKDFDDDSSCLAVDYLSEIGALDDSRYAENMIRRLIEQKHYGRRRIIQELSAKGIDRRTAEDVLEQFDTDEQSAIMELLQGKFSRDMDDEKGIRRTVNSLLRYGYEMGDILQVMRDYADSLDGENEE